MRSSAVYDISVKHIALNVSNDNALLPKRMCVWYWLPEVGGTYVFIFISKLAPVAQYHRMPAGKDNKITPHYCLSVDTLPLTPNPPKQQLYIARRNNKACVCASNIVTCSTFCSILERLTNQMGLRSGCNITKPAARALVSVDMNSLIATDAENRLSASKLTCILTSLFAIRCWSLCNWNYCAHGE